MNPSSYFKKISARRIIRTVRGPDHGKFLLVDISDTLQEGHACRVSM